MQDFSKFIVLIVVFLNVLFTMAVLYLFQQTGSEPSSLIVAWFAFTTGELFSLASIKKKKILNQDKELGDINND